MTFNIQKHEVPAGHKGGGGRDKIRPPYNTSIKLHFIDELQKKI